jgi:hypothetical protein
MGLWKCAMRRLEAMAQKEVTGEGDEIGKTM